MAVAVMICDSDSEIGHRDFFQKHTRTDAQIYPLTDLKSLYGAKRFSVLSPYPLPPYLDTTNSSAAPTEFRLANMDSHAASDKGT